MCYLILSREKRGKMAGSRIFGHTANMSEDVDIYHYDSVNIETRMMNLMENNIKCRATIEMLLRKMKILNSSIDERGRQFD